MLLFSASIAACESEKIFIYCMLFCLVLLKALQASLIVIISAWNTVVCIGSLMLSAIISRFLNCIV